VSDLRPRSLFQPSVKFGFEGGDIPISRSIAAGDFVRLSTLQVLGGSFSQDCGAAAFPDGRVPIQLLQQGFIEGDLYGFHDGKVSYSFVYECGMPP